MRLSPAHDTKLEMLNPVVEANPAEASEIRVSIFLALNFSKQRPLFLGLYRFVSSKQPNAKLSIMY